MLSPEQLAALREARMEEPYYTDGEEPTDEDTDDEATTIAVENPVVAVDDAVAVDAVAVADPIAAPIAAAAAASGEHRHEIVAHVNSVNRAIGQEESAVVAPADSGTAFVEIQRGHNNRPTRASRRATYQPIQDNEFMELKKTLGSNFLKDHVHQLLAKYNGDSRAIHQSFLNHDSDSDAFHRISFPEEYPVTAVNVDGDGPTATVDEEEPMDLTGDSGNEEAAADIAPVVVNRGAIEVVNLTDMSECSGDDSGDNSDSDFDPANVE